MCISVFAFKDTLLYQLVRKGRHYIESTHWSCCQMHALHYINQLGYLTIHKILERLLHIPRKENRLMYNLKLYNFTLIDQVGYIWKIKMWVWNARLHKKFELNGKHESPYIGEYLHLDKFYHLHTCVFIKLSHIWANSLLFCLHFHTSPHFDQFILTVSTYLVALCLKLKHVVYYKNINQKIILI